MTATPTMDDPAPTTAPDRPLTPSLPVRVVRYLRTPRHPRFVIELGLVALSYSVYSMIRNAVPDHQTLAIERSHDLWRLEQSLNINFERWLNHTVEAVYWLTISMNYFYAIMHFAVTGGVLVWLYWRHPGRYRAARTVLAITTVVALFGYFFYALAPPRLLPGGGFVDTVLLHDTWGAVTSTDMQSVTNQYAAMPSMHAGWSMWCGLAIVMFARHRWVKVVGALYPMATLLVITATGNHYVLDALGGWATLGLGFLLQRLIHGRPVHAFSRHVTVTAAT